MRHMFPAIVCAALLAVAGCTHNERNEFTAAVTEMARFADRMCACKDKACADRVMEDMSTWSTAMVKKFGKDRKPDDATMAKFSKSSIRFGDCINKLTPPVVEPTSVGPAVPEKPVQPASLTAPFTADRVLGAARAWTQAWYPDLTIADLQLSYVDAQGVLDPEAGGMEVRFAQVRPADDPRRRLGAPIRSSKDRKRDCPRLTFTADGRWRAATVRDCDDVPLLSARCDITEIWRRAIAKGAPAAALAVVTLDHSDLAPTWHLAISDPPRGVKFNLSTPDDCEPVVERPAAPPPPCDPFTSRHGCSDKSAP